MTSSDKRKQCCEMPNCERKVVMTARYHDILVIAGNEPVEKKRLKIQEQERGIL